MIDEPTYKMATERMRGQRSEAIQLVQENRMLSLMLIDAGIRQGLCEPGRSGTALYAVMGAREKLPQGDDLVSKMLGGGGPERAQHRREPPQLFPLDGSEDLVDQVDQMAVLSIDLGMADRKADVPRQRTKHFLTMRPSPITALT
jgi:hypothetical protein